MRYQSRCIYLQLIWPLFAGGAAAVHAQSHPREHLERWFSTTPGAQAPVHSPAVAPLPPVSTVLSAPEQAAPVPAGATGPAARPVAAPKPKPAPVPAEAALPGSLLLKLDRNFDSIKTMVFFTPGSARLGDYGQQTVKLLVPSVEKAGRVVIVGRTDATGPVAVNEALARKRAEAVAEALRKAGANKADLQISSDHSAKAVSFPPDAAALWAPGSPRNALRRADIDVGARKDAGD